MLMEAKSSQNSYQKSQKQIFDGKERIEEVLASIGIKVKWKYVGVFFAENGSGVPLFNCEKCSCFAIIDIKTFTKKMKMIEVQVMRHHNGWNPSEHVNEFVEIAKQLLFIAQGKDLFALVLTLHLNT